MHLVGFIIRIYHDAHSSERQTDPENVVTYWDFRGFSQSHHAFFEIDG